MEKKAISGVITAVIMIALVMAASSIVWSVVNNIVKDRLEEASSCFDTFEKVTINNRYTCYNTTSSELQISIGVKDIDLTSLLVSISDNKGNSKSFKLSETPLTENYLRLYTGNYGDPISIPEKNSGITYIINTISAGVSKPSSIQVAPVVGNKQCEVSDSLQSIDNCLALIF